MSPAQAEDLEGEVDFGTGIDAELADAAKKELLLRVPTQRDKPAIFLDHKESTRIVANEFIKV